VNELFGTPMCLFVGLVLLRLGQVSAFSHVQIHPASKQRPIENEIDVIRESRDQFVSLRKGSATFEYEMILELRCGEKQLEREADPVIVFDDERPNTYSCDRFPEEVVAIHCAQSSHLKHSGTPERSLESRRIPILWLSSCRSASFFAAPGTRAIGFELFAATVPA